MGIRCLWLATLGAAIAPGCPADESASESTVQFALTSSAFRGNSVRICGTRPTASSHLKCDSSLPSTPGEPPSCACYNFDNSGALVDSNGDPAAVSGLCPSSVSPAGDWTFDYAVFDSRDCEGTQLNDGAHDFVCYDSNDLATRSNPNQSVEPLNAGLNTNHILCAVSTASKTWDFTSCSIITTPEDEEAGRARYDCDCRRTDKDMCDCGEGGLTQLDLEKGCEFDSACNIVCGDEC